MEKETPSKEKGLLGCIVVKLCISGNEDNNDRFELDNNGWVSREQVKIRFNLNGPFLIRHKQTSIHFFTPLPLYPFTFSDYITNLIKHEIHPKELLLQNLLMVENTLSIQHQKLLPLLNKPSKEKEKMRNRFSLTSCTDSMLKENPKKRECIMLKEKEKFVFSFMVLEHKT
jgi:hypothetical protein